MRTVLSARIRREGEETLCYRDEKTDAAGSSRCVSFLPLFHCFCVLPQLPVNIPSAIHHPGNRNYPSHLIRYIEYTVIIYRHHAQSSAMPGLFPIRMISLRHLFKAHDLFFQTVQLAARIFRRLQFKCNIFIDVPEIGIRLFRHFNPINHNLAALLQTLYQEQFGDVVSESTQGHLSDLCSYSRDRVSVSRLNANTYFSTENMLPGKAGATEAASLPTTPQTTACHKGDTLISNIRPYFKKIVYCEDECGCSTDVLCFTPIQSRYVAYLFSTLYADKFFAFMVAGSKGTKMPRGDKQQIMSYPIVLPSDEELDEFNDLALPILTQIHSNRGENKRLSAVRDALLPKLMSGKIDVSAIQL